MLRQTFLHVPSVGVETEKSLWRQGAMDWETFLRDPMRWKITAGRRQLLSDVLEELAVAYEAKDAGYFAKRLPSSHRWRAFRDFEDNAGYLDIETDGGIWENSVTVIGLYYQDEMYSFVKGKNLASFPRVARQCKMLVTFFGTGFDLPILAKLFPSFGWSNKIHIDLCCALKKLGYRGGLKSIEKELGIERSGDTIGLTGMDAITLWNRYRKGNLGALETLLRYNAEDTINMQPLMRYAYSELKKRLEL